MNDTNLPDAGGQPAKMKKAFKRFFVVLSVIGAAVVLVAIMVDRPPHTPIPKVKDGGSVVPYIAF